MQKQPLFVLILCLFFACQNKSDSKTANKNTAEKVVFYPIKILKAKNFQVEYFENFKLLTINGLSKKIVLKKKGLTLSRKFEKAQIVEVPLRKVVTLSATQVAFLEKLDLESNIVAHDKAAYLSDGKTLESIRKGQIKEVGEEEHINQELILALKPDIVFTNVPDFSKFKVLSKAGIILLPCLEWKENTPLGRAEWLKFMALFFNKEELAAQKFAQIQSNYDNLSEALLGYLDTKKTSKPKVLTQLPFKDTWYVAGGSSYFAQFLKDAGAEYIWAENGDTGSLALDFETVFAKASKADFWLNVGTAQSKKTMLEQDKRFEKFKAFQTGQVYNHSKGKSLNAYWMRGTSSPDKVLADLIRIFYPDFPQARDSFFYYEKIE